MNPSEPKCEIERGLPSFGSRETVLKERRPRMRQLKIIVEKHPDGYVAYPLGLKGVVVGQGGTYEEALSDVKSAIRFHIESFGAEVLDIEPPILEAFIAETGVEV
jgi:predicted RNase H-like HicB family nuclease